MSILRRIGVVFWNRTGDHSTASQPQQQVYETLDPSLAVCCCSTASISHEEAFTNARTSGELHKRFDLFQASEIDHFGVTSLGKSFFGILRAPPYLVVHHNGLRKISPSHALHLSRSDECARNGTRSSQQLDQQGFGNEAKYMRESTTKITKQGSCTHEDCMARVEFLPSRADRDRHGGLRQRPWELPLEIPAHPSRPITKPPLCRLDSAQFWDR